MSLLSTRKIKYEGEWWRNPEVDKIILEQLKEILSSTAVISIDIRGVDLNDGRENRYCAISAMDGEVIIQKNF